MPQPLFFMELPEDYQIGFKQFLGAKIDLSKRPFIPREETEYWVSFALKEIKKKNKALCLDLFSGSGCIGVAVLKNIDESLCDFGEKEELFLEQIKINLRINNISEERYNIIQTDVFSNIKRKYDFILANPPYVALKRINEVGEDVKQYEPPSALYGGKEGLDIIKEFLFRANDFLRKGGKVFMEFDPGQKQAVEDLLRDKYSKTEFFKDQFNKYRFLRLEK